MDNLETIIEQIRSELEQMNDVRDATLERSRTLIRYCANAIKAVHRGQWEQARAGLETARTAAREMMQEAQAYPELYYSGFTQDALKEYVEAFIIYALVHGDPLPTPAELNVEGPTYLNGLAEAASELRRTVLDIMRHDHQDEAERHLDAIDAIYNDLMTFDFPDAVTHGLRRRVDALRGVLERTRGDLTTSLRQQRLREALERLERYLAQSGQIPDGGEDGR